ncbi:hypothetical protein NEOKW01_0649 [Nematocida sp. AWRm80]|nr:hypothetical protein NEOKW01_0649 [Nematocida sp. AWRm80]
MRAAIQTQTPDISSKTPDDQKKDSLFKRDTQEKPTETEAPSSYKPHPLITISSEQIDDALGISEESISPAISLSDQLRMHTRPPLKTHTKWIDLNTQNHFRKPSPNAMKTHKNIDIDKHQTSPVLIDIAFSAGGIYTRRQANSQIDATDPKEIKHIKDTAADITCDCQASQCTHRAIENITTVYSTIIDVIFSVLYRARVSIDPYKLSAVICALLVPYLMHGFSSWYTRVLGISLAIDTLNIRGMHAVSRIAPILGILADMLEIDYRWAVFTAPILIVILAHGIHSILSNTELEEVSELFLIVLFFLYIVYTESLIEIAGPINIMEELTSKRVVLQVYNGIFILFSFYSLYGALLVFEKNRWSISMCFLVLITVFEVFLVIVYMRTQDKWLFLEKEIAQALNAIHLSEHPLVHAR